MNFRYKSSISYCKTVCYHITHEKILTEPWYNSNINIYHGIPTFSAKINNKLIKPSGLHQILVHKKCFLDIEKKGTKLAMLWTTKKDVQMRLNIISMENVINKVAMETNKE